MTSLPGIYFFCGGVIISWKHFKQFKDIYYNKLPVVDSKKFEEYVYLRKAIVALLF